MPSTKGMALEVGMDRSFLPAMQSFGLKGGPGGTNSGVVECAAMTALAWSRSGTTAEAAWRGSTDNTLLATTADIKDRLRDINLSIGATPPEATELGRRPGGGATI
jgi:hypothetical protein